MMDEEKTSELKGVRGWLLFMVVALTVLGPARGAWKTYASWRDLAASYPEYLAGSEGQLLQTIAWTSYAIGATLSIGTGILLFRHHRPESIRIAIFNLWLMGPVISLAGYFVAVFAVDEPILLSDFKVMLIPTASAILWTTYLLRSCRVKNTYGFNGPISRRQAAEELA